VNIGRATFATLGFFVTDHAALARPDDGGAASVHVDLVVESGHVIAYGMARGKAAPPAPPSMTSREKHMPKYLLAWLLGVPVGLLILIYLFAHLI
jgi:hypothetical protein